MTDEEEDFEETLENTLENIFENTLENISEEPDLEAEKTNEYIEDYEAESQSSENLTFSEAISYVKSLDVFGSVLGLDNMRHLAAELDNPQDGLRFVHVTGTNGKGSVCAFLTSIIKSAGYKVGSYNSPAVLSDIDQFRINGEIISEDLYAEAVSLVKSACEKVTKEYGVNPTRFEVETMVAFVSFYIEKCDIVELETGLGGRDDATNIINNTLLHVITSISMDHCAILGDTLLEIAEVKSGIIKSSAPVLLFNGIKSDMSENEIDRLSEVNGLFVNKCIEAGAHLYTVSESSVSNLVVNKDTLTFNIREFDLEKLSISMVGAYQPSNAAMAVAAARILSNIGYNISELSIRDGLLKAKLPFRFQKITANDKVDIILDGAHNPDGAWLLTKSLALIYPDREFNFVTGIFKDKDYEEIAKITAPKASKIFVIQNTDSARSLDKEKLSSVFNKFNKNVVMAETIESALDEAVSEAENRICANATNPIVVCFGSLSWLNRARKHIEKIDVNNSGFESIIDDNIELGEEFSTEIEEKSEEINNEELKFNIEDENKIENKIENEDDIEKINNSSDKMEENKEKNKQEKKKDKKSKKKSDNKSDKKEKESNKKDTNKKELYKKKSKKLLEEIIKEEKEAEAEKEAQIINETENVSETQIINETENVSEAQETIEAEIGTEAQETIEVKTGTETQEIKETQIIDKTKKIVEAQIIDETKKIIDVQEISEAEKITEDQVTNEPDIDEKAQVLSEADTTTKADVTTEADTITEVQNKEKIHEVIGERKLDSEKIREGIKLILEGIGEDPEREGLKDTPERVARMYEEIFAGMGKTAQADLEKTFTSDAKEMVIEKDIEFFSTCEHHLLPFYGKAHIAYIPDGKVVGLSKLARCVEIYSKKPQIQEQLTEEIAEAIMKYLKPKGVIVMLEAEHMCMSMRGVKKPGTKTVTISVKGRMKKKENQDLFFQMINR